MEILDGQVIDTRPGHITLDVLYTDIGRVCDRKYSKAYVCFEDGRTISREQQKFAHALMGDIADWQGDTPENVKALMKVEFVVHRLDQMYQEIFARKGGVSLATDSITVARMFIDYLIEFVIVNNVPCKEPIYRWYEDIPKYVYHCLMNKRCAVCGKSPADLDHWDCIGMGRNRDTIYQIGWRVIPLCRIHHGEAHSKGRGWLADDLHLEPVALTAEIGRVYGLTRKNLQKEV